MELIIKNLSKTYQNGVKALHEIFLNIPQGMFGLLGPNGAGKSTLMRTIATLQEADQGSVHLNGLDVLKQKDEVRKILGYLPQEFGVYPKISAEMMLDHIASLKGITNKTNRKKLVVALLHKVNLYDERKKKLGTFSGGMKQRFGIAQALLGDPKLIIVDEPTAGLDPLERNRFHNLLSEIGENTIVILSTHIVDDVSTLCRNMAIINHGQVVQTGTPSALIGELQDSIWKKTIDKSELEAYNERLNVIYSHLIGGKTEIIVQSAHAPDASFTNKKVDLEDVYFSTIKKTSQKELLTI